MKPALKLISPEAQHPAPNILIVDDTPANLDLLTGMLKKQGYRVRPVPSGKLAVQAVQKEKPDLILLDIIMPEMNGYELCAQFKADATLKDIPILFISALAETADKIKAFTAGGVDYITKPFQFEEVEARVQTHLELRRLQIELAVQNERLQGTRDETEALLEKYTDLYDFAPVGYFSLDERGGILDVNLTGTVLLGVERSRLIDQCLPRFVTPESRPGFVTFLKQLFAGSEKRVCEATLLKADGSAFWANFHGVSAISLDSPLRWCRVAVSDITAYKQAEEAQRRIEAITRENLALQHEITRRKVAEDTVRQSEQHQVQLLEQSRHMQQQLRQLSHRILHVQEEERKRISRELHDEVTQTLVGINVHLETLAKEAESNSKGLKQKIARTQRLVEKSVDVVHRFARELRPTMLDDLGLIPALHSLMKIFMKETGIRVSLTVFEEVEKLNIAKRTVLYRVAQEALNNVASHAQATKVEVNIQRLPKALLMQIKDNGKSFDVESALKPKKNKRLGLIGMRERLEMVNGQFAIESVPGKGTTIQAQIPFAGRTKERAVS